MDCVGPRVTARTSSIPGYERAVGFRRDDPMLSAMGWRMFFLKPGRSCCRWHDRDVESTTLLQQRKLKRARPWVLAEHDKASSWLPSRRKNPRTAGTAR